MPNFNGGTWPTASLTLTDDGIVFSFMGKSRSLAYSDVDHFEVTRTGFIRFITKNQSYSFAFTSVGIRKIVSILQDKQVAVDASELAKLPVATFFIWAQIIFGAGFLILWLTLLVHSLFMGAHNIR